MLDSKLIQRLRVLGPQNICRMCLRDVSIRDIVGTKLPHMIESCFGFEITSDNLLPQRICTMCFRQIVRFYTYKQKVARCQDHLRLFADSNRVVIKVKQETDVNRNAFRELENVHEEIQKKTMELKECTQKIISYNFGPPPLVPIRAPESVVIKKNGVRGRPAPEDDPEWKEPPLPPLIPLRTDKSALKRPESSSVQDCAPFSCHICKEAFGERIVLMKHLKKHKTARYYLCNFCGKRYSTPSTFRVHMRSHTGEKPFKCDICGKRFARRAGVKSHMVSHKNVQPFKCETCKKGFKTSSNLYRHHLLHSGVCGYTCSSCEKSFNQSEHLKVHERIYHTKEKPYLCSECGKGFVNLQRLKRHSWIHNGQKPYPCCLCPKAYTNSADLKNHQVKIHQGRTVQKLFGCSLCDRKFTHPCRLAKHRQYHSDDKSN